MPTNATLRDSRTVLQTGRDEPELELTELELTDELRADVARMVKCNTTATRDIITSAIVNPTQLVPHDECYTLVEHLRLITSNSYKTRMLAATKEMKGRDNEAVKACKARHQEKMKMQEAANPNSNPNSNPNNGSSTSDALCQRCDVRTVSNRVQYATETHSVTLGSDPESAWKLLCSCLSND